MSTGLIRQPRVIAIYEGSRHAVGRYAGVLGARAFVVTDARFAGTAEFGSVRDSLRAAGIAFDVYGETVAELPSGQVESAVRRAAAFAPDVLVAVGGGSCIDMAKVIAILLRHGGDFRDYVGEFLVPGPVVPVIAVPTTAGTGAEATPVAVVLDEERGIKAGISSPEIIPHTALVDPELTYSAPPALTASVGADALAHLTESFTAIARDPSPELVTRRVFVGKGELTDLYGLTGATLLAANLRRAVHHGQDTAARHNVARASLYGGLALGTAGTTAAHALQYPVGALTHTPHGVGVGVLLPYVLRYNRDFAVDSLAELAAAFGAESGWSAARRSDFTVDAITTLLADIGIPPTLAELGMREADLEAASVAALDSRRLIDNNPRPIDAADTLAILRAAYDGRRPHT